MSEHWQTVMLESLYLEPSRNGLTRPKRVRGSGFPMINMGEIFAHDRIGDIEMERVPMNVKEVASFSIQRGDLLFARQSLVAAGAGKCAFVKSVAETTTFESHLIRVRLDHDRVVPEFYFYYFLSPQGKANIQSLVMQVAAAGIRGSELSKLPVPLPPRMEQKRIAGILSAYDELIENSQRRIEILESMASALYREWFVHFRFPGHENHPRVPSPVGDIPLGWEVVSIDDVCARVTDGSHFSPKSVNDGLPMASSKDMHDWGLNLDTARLISREDFADLVRNDCKPKKNDVLITKDGANYLKYIFVTRAEQEVVLLSSVAMLRPNAKINPHLLAAILKDPENKGRLKSYVTGAAIPRVVLKDFKRFELLLPKKDVQTAWAKVVEPITEQIWQLIDEIQNLRRTRDLLLPRLLSGQIDVKAAA